MKVDLYNMNHIESDYIEEVIERAWEIFNEYDLQSIEDHGGLSWQYYANLDGVSNPSLCKNISTAKMVNHLTGVRLLDESDTDLIFLIDRALVEIDFN